MIKIIIIWPTNAKSFYLFFFIYKNLIKKSKNLLNKSRVRGFAINNITHKQNNMKEILLSVTKWKKGHDILN